MVAEGTSLKPLSDEEILPEGRYAVAPGVTTWQPLNIYNSHYCEVWSWAGDMMRCKDPGRFVWLGAGLVGDKEGPPVESGKGGFAFVVCNRHLPRQHLGEYLFTLPDGDPIRVSQLPDSALPLIDKEEIRVIRFNGAAARYRGDGATRLKRLSRLLQKLGVEIELSAPAVGYATGNLVFESPPTNLFQRVDYMNRLRRVREGITAMRFDLERSQRILGELLVQGKPQLQFLHKSLMTSLAEDVATWPEVMEAGLGPYTSAYWPADKVESGLFIRFWPVLFDGERGTVGLTPPLAYQIDTSGGVTAINHGLALHPHEYGGRGGSLCWGAASLGVSFIRSLTELRNWVIGTDGSPATEAWRYQSQDWWHDHSREFFSIPNTKYLLSPAGPHEFVKVFDFPGTELENLLDYNTRELESSIGCAHCGREMYRDEGCSCDMCGWENICDDCYSFTYSRCIRCLVECEQCYEWVDEAQYCEECGRSVCEGCYNYNCGMCERCVELSEEEEEDEDEDELELEEVQRQELALFDQQWLARPLTFGATAPAIYSRPSVAPTIYPARQARRWN